MNRRQFLFSAAAALTVAPAATKAAETLQQLVDNALYAVKPSEGWHLIGYDTAHGEDRAALVVFNVHDEHIYLADYENDFSTDALRVRWRAKVQEFDRYWSGVYGTIGR